MFSLTQLHRSDFKENFSFQILSRNRHELSKIKMAIQ